MPTQQHTVRNAQVNPVPVARPMSPSDRVIQCHCRQPTGSTILASRPGQRRQSADAVKFLTQAAEKASGGHQYPGTL